MLETTLPGTRMDGDIQAQFDHMMAFIATQFEKSEARMNVRFDALETRMEALETRMGALEGRLDALETRVREGFLGVSEQFATVSLRLDQLDGRLASRLAEVDHRRTAIEL